MESNEFFKEQLIVYLTIESTSYQEVEVEITDPNKTVRDQIDSIVQVFQLPKMDAGGNPIRYLLGKSEEDSSDPTILEQEDEDGLEKCMADYDIQRGDHLQLISEVIAG